MGLNSESSIRIVDLLCEGPIESIVGGRKGVFLDETALKSQSGADNVKPGKVKFKLNHGTKDQGYQNQAKKGVSNVVNIGREVGKGYEEVLDKKTGTFVRQRNYGSGKIVHQVTDLDVDSVDLIFTVPRLFSTAQEGLVKGQLFDAAVFFDVFIQSVGSGKGYKRVKTNEVTSSETFNKSKNVFYIEGISTTNYQYKISNIELEGKGPWNIRVRKYPQDKYKGNISHGKNNAKNIDREIFSASFKSFENIDKRKPLKQGRANSLIWTSVVENQKIRSAHPFTATVGMTISTSEFPSLPTRSYLVRGRKVAIPDNAKVENSGRLTFDGNFTGELKKGKWTTCPVCIFYDLLTNKRYGAGHHVAKGNINWLDLYPLSKYCNEKVGNEARFACNVSVNSQAQAFTVLQDFASVFRGMMYWYTNTIQLTADHGQLNGGDIDPVHVFNNANVVDGVFNYSGTSLKTRSTSIKVRYVDPDNFYKPNVVCVEDSSLIEKYGYQEKEMLAFACTSKKQAKRLGRWMLKSEELDGFTVTFSVGLEGALVLPGQIFIIQDESRAGTRFAGRISQSPGTLNTGSETTTGVELALNKVVVDRNNVQIPSGSNPRITCVLRDGGVETKDIIKEQSGGSVVTTESDFSSLPLAGSVYSIGSDNVREQKFRCVTVSDQGDGVFSVVGVEHNDSIYNAVDEDEDIEFLDITKLDNQPPTPVI